MRVTVIGGKGHIGTYLVPRLVEAGHAVTNLSRGQAQPYLPHNAWRRVGQVMEYAIMSYYVDTGNTAGAGLLGKAQGLMAKALAATAFVDPELLSIGQDTLRHWMADEPRLAIYKHHFDDLIRQKAHLRSAEVEEVLGLLSEPFSSTSQTASELTNTDLKFKPAKASDGTRLDLGQSSIDELITHKDRKVRKNAWKNYADGYLGHSLGVYNNYVFAAADNQGLIIIDVNDPSNPSLANTITSTRPTAVYIHNNLLFLANWVNDFEIYNLSTSPVITEVARFGGEGFSYTYAKDDLVFAFANNGSLLILDISNPEQIEIMSQIDDDELTCIAIDGNIWYTGGPNGIKVFNSSIQTDPILISHFTETEESFFTNLMVLDNKLYASDFNLGFRIFNVSTPFQISEIGRNDAGGAPLGFQVDGNIAYVASQTRGIQIIKIQFSDAESTFLGLEFILLPFFLLTIFSRERRIRNKNT